MKTFIILLVGFIFKEEKSFCQRFEISWLNKILLNIKSTDN